LAQGAGNECALATTAADKKSNCTNADHKHAEPAGKTHEMVGPPSLADFLCIVDNNLLLNNPITREDAANAEDPFGPVL